MDRVVTGIVMEISSDGAVVMTKSGEFLKVKKPCSDISPGDEITSTAAATSSAASHRFNIMKYAGIAALILILLIPFVYFRQVYATVAYVNVDINPSIEMGINRYNKVNDVYGLNDDGTELIAKINIKGSDIHDALDSIISAARECEYISDSKDNNIEVVLVPLDNKNVNITEDNLADYVYNAVQSTRVEATIKVQGADKKIHDDAAKENMSTNKYLDKAQDNKDYIKVDVKKQPGAVKYDDKSSSDINGNSDKNSGDAGNSSDRDDKQNPSQNSNDSAAENNDKGRDNAAGNDDKNKNNDIDKGNDDTEHGSGQGQKQDDKPQPKQDNENNQKGKE